MEELIDFIEGCLKKYEYPNIYGVQMAEIFGAPNRIFLLSWLFRLIQNEDCSYLVPQEELAEFLNVYGFCKSSESKKVIESDLEYPVQLKILYKIFKLLDSVKRERKIDENSDELSIDDLKNLRQKDLNIFRNFGPLKIHDDTDLQVKISGTENQMNMCSKEVPGDLNVNSKSVGDLLQIEKNIKSVIVIVSDILKHKDAHDVNIQLDNEAMHVLQEFNRDVQKAKEYIINVEALSRFSEEFNTCLQISSEGNDECIEMVKKVIRNIHEIHNM